MPFFTGVANSLSIYKNLHTMHDTMVAAKAGYGGVARYSRVESEGTQGSCPLAPQRLMPAFSCGWGWKGRVSSFLSNTVHALPAPRSRAPFHRLQPQNMPQNHGGGSGPR